MEQMRLMLEKIIGRDAQEEMLAKLNPAKLYDPTIHSFIQTKLVQMGIDAQLLIETQPQTYELLRLLYCCNLTEENTDGDNEMLI